MLSTRSIPLYCHTDIVLEREFLLSWVSLGISFDQETKYGDIDLYIISKVQDDLFRKKIKLKTLLEDLLYKPVDIIVSTDKERLIEKEAIKKGIIL